MLATGTSIFQNALNRLPEMKGTTIGLLVLLGCIPAVAEIVHQEEYTVQTEGEKVYREVKERIEIPDAEYEALPRYEMGKGPLPVTMEDVVRLADAHFKKTLGIPFSEQNGFIDINLSWTGNLVKPVWFYHVVFRPGGKDKLADPERWDYQLAIPMNGKVYASTNTRVELVDTSDPIKESGIPFLQTGQRSKLHVIENELSRLGKGTNLSSDKVPGVYLHKDGTSAYIFYPDGNLFTIHTITKSLYKVDEKGKVYTTYLYGDNKEKLSSYEYIGVVKNGRLIIDHGDYHHLYYLRDDALQRVEESKPDAKSKTKPK